MSDIELELVRRIEASSERVWAVLTDLDRASEVLSGVTRIERLGGPGYAVGTRWRETRTMLGKEATEEMEVVGIEPGRSTTIAAEAGGIASRTVFALEPDDDRTGIGTLLRMRFAGTLQTMSWVQRVAAKLTAPIGMSVTRKAMQQDLDDIAAEAERV